MTRYLTKFYRLYLPMSHVDFDQKIDATDYAKPLKKRGYFPRVELRYQIVTSGPEGTQFSRSFTKKELREFQKKMA